MFVATTLTLLNPLLASKVNAETVRNSFPSQQEDCGELLAGSYFIRHETTLDFPKIPQLITLSKDGNFLAVDGVAAGYQDKVTGKTVTAFSNAQGTWKCIGKREVAATSIEIVYPGLPPQRGGLLRVDYQIKFDADGQKITAGDIKVRVYDYVSGEPLKENSPVVEQFSFTGQRINVIQQSQSDNT